MKLIFLHCFLYFRDGFREEFVGFSRNLFWLKISFLQDVWISLINLGYHINSIYSHPLLFTLYFSSTIPSSLPCTSLQQSLTLYLVLLFNNPLLFTLYFSSTNQFSHLWMCLKLLAEWQRVQTLIRRRNLRCLIWMYTICSSLSFRIRRVRTRNHPGSPPPTPHPWGNRRILIQTIKDSVENYFAGWSDTKTSSVIPVCDQTRTNSLVIICKTGWPRICCWFKRPSNPIKASISFGNGNL